MKPRETEHSQKLRDRIDIKRAVEDAWFAGQDVEVYIGGKWELIDEPNFEWQSCSYRIKREQRVVYIEELNSGFLCGGWQDAPVNIRNTGTRLRRFVEDVSE